MWNHDNDGDKDEDNYDDKEEEEDYGRVRISSENVDVDDTSMEEETIRDRTTQTFLPDILAPLMLVDRSSQSRRPRGYLKS